MIDMATAKRQEIYETLRLSIHLKILSIFYEYVKKQLKSINKKIRWKNITSGGSMKYKIYF